MLAPHPKYDATWQVPAFREMMASFDMVIVETAMNDVEDLPKSMVGAGRGAVFCLALANHGRRVGAGCGD